MLFQFVAPLKGSLLVQSRGQSTQLRSSVQQLTSLTVGLSCVVGLDEVLTMSKKRKERTGFTPQCWVYAGDCFTSDRSCFNAGSPDKDPNVVAEYPDPKLGCNEEGKSLVAPKKSRVFCSIAALYTPI